MSELIPLYEYDTGPTSLALTVPQRPWEMVNSSVGGFRVAAAGTPTAYLVRDDPMLRQHIRFFENEWPAVRLMILYAMQLPNTVTIYPDANDLYTSHDCYLMSPSLGQEWQPTREPESDFVYTLSLLWRKVDLTPWDDVYFQ